MFRIATSIPQCVVFCFFVDIPLIVAAFIHVKLCNHQKIQKAGSGRLFLYRRRRDNSLQDQVTSISSLLYLSTHRFVSNYQLNAQFLYSITIYMLHHNPRHVSSSTLHIFRRTNCIITAPGNVTLCKRPYSTLVESGLN